MVDHNLFSIILFHCSAYYFLALIVLVESDMFCKDIAVGSMINTFLVGGGNFNR